ncbi:MAG: CpsB/CapC family capsule biosynthesis tyrosine phosphatase [Solirubrobacteraceae bacterium]
MAVVSCSTARPGPDRDNRRVHVAVDLHCHILPGLDDGARDLTDAVEMARQAEGDGIEAICATPHIRPDYRVEIGSLPGRRAELRAALAAAGCATRILPGGELAAPLVNAIDDRELDGIALGGGGRWVLLEPAPGPLDVRIEHAVEALRVRGRRAVIAHPERHLAVDLADRLCRLLELGALVQVTADYFLRADVRDGMLWLARHGLAHLLGSDAHSSQTGRPVALRGALDALAAAGADREALQWMAHTAPIAIVSGRDLEPPPALMLGDG